MAAVAAIADTVCAVETTPAGSASATANTVRCRGCATRLTDIGTARRRPVVSGGLNPFGFGPLDIPTPNPMGAVLRVFISSGNLGQLFAWHHKGQREGSSADVQTANETVTQDKADSKADWRPLCPTFDRVWKAQTIPATNR